MALSQKNNIMWSYRCYGDGRQPNLWQEWYDANPDYQGSHDSIFDTLELLEPWKPPYTKLFISAARIYEVRLRGAVRYRILGCYGDVRKEFIVLGTCSHKQNVYTPANIRQTVIDRKKEVDANPGKAQPCVRPT